MAERWIASRELVDDAGHVVCNVRLGEPRRTTEGRWVCVVRFDEGAEPHETETHGADAFQALFNGLECLRLGTTNRGLSWLIERGSPGFPAFLPLTFGQEFHDSLGAFVEAEARKRVEAFQADRIARLAVAAADG